MYVKDLSQVMHNALTTLPLMLPLPPNALARAQIPHMPHMPGYGCSYRHACGSHSESASDPHVCGQCH